jgi:ABC-type Mn2+/Zn2+ transport system ATPase subunit
MSSILECVELLIGHDRPITKAIDLSLNQGELLFISGANGSGKSTFIKSILREIPILQGELKLHIAASDISYLPQLTQSQMWASYTFEEILEVFAVQEKYRAFLSSELRQKRWIESSGGEKQRLLVITRLASDLSLLILDEPFNFLDEASIKSLQALLLDLLNSQSIKSMIIVSHIPLNVGGGKLNIKEWRLEP